MKEEKRSYIGGLLHGIGTLLTGMKITGREFFTPKVTEQPVPTTPFISPAKHRLMKKQVRRKKHW